METIIVWALMVVAPWSSSYEERGKFLNLADCTEMAVAFRGIESPAFCEPQQVPTKGQLLAPIQ